MYIYVSKRLCPIPPGLGRVGLGCLGGSLLECFLWCFGLQVGGLGSKLAAWKALLESILGLVGLGGQEAAGKGSGRAWVGPGWLAGHDGLALQKSLLDSLCKFGKVPNFSKPTRHSPGWYWPGSADLDGWSCSTLQRSGDYLCRFSRNYFCPSPHALLDYGGDTASTLWPF